MEEYCPETSFRYLCAINGGRVRSVLPLYDRHSSFYFNSLTTLPRPARALLGRMRSLVGGSPLSFVNDVIGDHLPTTTVCVPVSRVARVVLAAVRRGIRSREGV